MGLWIELYITTRQRVCNVSLTEWKLLTLPEHPSSPHIFSVLSVIRFMVSDYPFGILKLFLTVKMMAIYSGAGTANPFGSHEFTQCFSGVRVAHSLLPFILVMVVSVFSYLRLLITHLLSLNFSQNSTWSTYWCI